MISLLGQELRPFLDDAVKDGGGITRRAGLCELMVDCREWHRHHRRMYTNQSMINDLYGIYLPNRAIEVLDSEKAMGEEDIRHYLYQSVGLEPWLGSETEKGPAKPLGENYLQLTAKGLTRELGYVGGYGEVLDWVTSIYDATRPAPGEAGDEKIKQQLIKIANARAAFREPFVDADGNRAMAMETVIGWRDMHYPGDITYGQRPSWDGGPLDCAAAILDPASVGYAQQMVNDHQFFATIQESMKNNGLRVTAGLLRTPDAYATMMKQPPSSIRLPMTAGQPDSVFSDEEDGVVAIRHGRDVLYASLYWRARYAVNFLARVHLLRPTEERDVTVWEDVQFDDSGLKYTVDDRVIKAFTRRHEKSRGDVQQALKGEVFPIAKVPASIAFKPGDENVYAGKGTFYTLRYGDYLVGMNMTEGRVFELAVPAGSGEVMELVSRKMVPRGVPLKVAARSTVVLYMGKD